MKIIKINSCNSTNEEIYKYSTLIKEQYEFALISEYQTKGKGMKDNVWYSEEGKNILISLIHYPLFLSPLKHFYFSMVISLSIVDLLKIYDIKSNIKWPNDIIVDGKKISGILIESEIMSNKFKYIISGIGINVNQKNFENIENLATSILNETEKYYKKNVIVNKLIECIANRLADLKNGEYKLIKKCYLNNLKGFKEKLYYKDLKGKIIINEIVDICDDGKIVMIDEKDEYIKYDFKEIEYIGESINEVRNL